MSVPPLLELDPAALSAESDADLKNKLMVEVLTRLPWFRTYRERLRAFRKHGGKRPMYPNDRVNKIDRMVVRLISESKTV